MTFIFIIILVVFIFVPLAKAFWAVYSQMRQVKRFMNNPTDFFGGTGGNRRRSPGSATGAGQKIHKKKFGKDVGEYVDFEEIDVASENRSAGGGDSVRYKDEDQVTDIKWEDIR